MAAECSWRGNKLKADVQRTHVRSFSIQNRLSPAATKLFNKPRRVRGQAAAFAGLAFSAFFALTAAVLRLMYF
jgi:hypothetical protein